MKLTTLAFVATLIACQYGITLALPLDNRIPASIHPASHGTRLDWVSSDDMDDEDAVDLPKLDNRDYIPTATDTPADILEQPKPIPTLYLMSFERPAETEEEIRRNSWLKFQRARSLSAQDETDTNPTYLSENPDIVVIAMFAAFALVATFIEVRQRALSAASEAKCKMGFVVGLPGQLRLEGDEKRLLIDVEETPRSNPLR